MININRFMFYSCLFSVFYLGYVGLKSAILIDNEEFKLSYYTAINIPFERFFTHHYTVYNIQAGIICILLIIFFMKMGNSFFKQWQKDKKDFPPDGCLHKLQKKTEGYSELERLKKYETK